MRMAAEHGIAPTTRFMDLADGNATPDIIIDVTGVNMATTGNRRTSIMSEIEACLLMSLSRASLVELKPDEQGC